MSKRRRIAISIAALAALMLAGIVIAPIAWPPISNCRGHRPTKAQADVAVIMDAVERFRLDHDGRVPTTDQGLQVLVAAKDVQTRTGYLDRAPIDPWGREYIYSSDGQSYSVMSLGADGVRGGEAENADVDDWSIFR